MGVRYPSVQSTTFIGPFPASAVETVCFTTPPLTIPLDFAAVFLFAYISISAGTGTVSLTHRIRRGATITGALVNSGTGGVNVVAGATAVLSLCFPDTPGPVAGQQYSYTIQQNGATAAGTFQDGAMLAFAL